MDEYDRFLLFAAAGGEEARMSYGLDSGDYPCLLVGHPAQECFPEAFYGAGDVAEALKWLGLHGYVYVCPLVERINEGGYVSEERQPPMALSGALEWLSRA